MANLPNELAKLQIEETEAEQPVSESVIQKAGKSINGLIDRFNSKVEFTTSGSWVVPLDCEQIVVLGCGGGGGGGSGGNGVDASNDSGTGGGGGYGAATDFIIAAVTPGSTLTVTIGSGGASNADGGSSSISGAGLVNYGTILFPGGLKGAAGTTVNAPAATGGSGGSGYVSSAIGYRAGYPGGTGGGIGPGADPSNGLSGTAASSTHFLGGTRSGATGGSGGALAGGGSGGGGGGGGGSSSFGIGGNGGNGGSNGNPGAAGAAAVVTRYGAGGGGGGGGTEAGSQPGGAGGAGAPGYIAIFFSGD